MLSISLVPFVLLFALSHEELELLVHANNQETDYSDEAVAKCDNILDLTMFNQSSRRVVYS